MGFLVASVAVLLVGPLTYALAARATVAFKFLDLIVIISVGGLLILHILPEIFIEVGWLAAIPLLAGLLGPALLERAAVGLEREAHIILLALVLVGLAFHALLDGIALALPTHSTHGAGADPSLPLVVVLHRIPVSLLIWWLVRPRWGALAAWLVLAIEGSGAVAGYSAAYALAAHVHGPWSGGLQALVAGSILHVLVDRHDYRAGQDEHPH